ncbi:hypothetical protein [Streptomyces sp. NRRL S-337]|uniref:hypothetical protein n=1 Tax=Streptomyces sp. NRRL S-337 TaxID=1463900 RepID=UPI0004CA2C0F|nr:hypothetical protein [Streptomyces sp. NRRL S-337]
MTASEIDEALSTLARCSAVLLKESQAEQQRVEELNERSETSIQQHAEGRGSPYDAEYALLSVRLRLAIQCAKAHRDAAHEFVCWWMDAAVTAWNSAVHGTPMPYTRLGAAAPDTLMLDEDLAVLPRVDEQTRKLLELGSFLGAPQPSTAPGTDDGLSTMITDLAACSGVSIQRSGTDAIEVVDDDDPEARRRRLWGDCWLELRIPTLPAGGELDALLGRAPRETADRLLNAARAVVSAAMASLRMSELEDTGTPWTPAEMDEYDQLSAQHDRLTQLLANYAQAVTESLADMRA